MTSPGATVLLTGATGFLGKVVLEELLRRHDELAVERVWVLIRPHRPATPRARFQRKIATSPALAALPDDWRSRVKVVGGDLAAPGGGLSEADREALESEVTHIIHCAASVEFDLPLADALAANTTSALEVLELARRCRHLVSMVAVSTAYVTPHRGGIQRCEEVLPPLPEPAAALYDRIRGGRADERKVLRATGHPNTYTLTKALAEHLLAERRGDVPLSIVRPSIITASRRWPLPGWIDNVGAFAAFVWMVGGGYHRVLIARPETALDLVPCDEVSARVIRAAFHPPPRGGAVVIRHAVAGLRNACTVELCVDAVLRFFETHPLERRARLRYIGPRGALLELQDAIYHRLPTATARLWFRLTRKQRLERAAVRLADRRRRLHEVFPYFTCNTFDFRSSDALEHDFDQTAYIRLVAQGVMRHLLDVDDTELPIAGHRHRPAVGDFRWALGQPKGNWVHRVFACIIAKAFRRGVDVFTFDEPSFERALAQVSPGDGVVIVPAHRSYVDFILLPYLCFARPDLGVEIPYLAAADEFRRIFLLGWLLKRAQAFYIKRGVGREDPDLSLRIRELVRKRRVLLFFIEGQRSRARRFLSPRRGILRSLQATGKSFTILPVAFGYERLPEESVLMQELRGRPKGRMSLGSVLAWFGELRRGQVRLGRMHLAAGSPVRLSEESDVHAVSHAIVAELQRATVVSTFHLRAFIAHSGGAAAGIDVEWLRHAIMERGGRVLDSRLHPENVDAATERCLRYDWAHWFYDDIEAQLGAHAVVRHHLARNRYRTAQGARAVLANDPRLHWLLTALMEPVCGDYRTAAALLERADRRSPPPAPAALAATAADAHLPDLEGAFEQMAEQGILAHGNGTAPWAWGHNADQLSAYRERCEWPPRRPAADAVDVRRAQGDPSAIPG